MYPLTPLHIHLLGICGTGMAALAGILKEQGYGVSGSDEHAYPPMSTFLAGLGIAVRNGYAPENLSPGRTWPWWATSSAGTTPRPRPC